MELEINCIEKNQKAFLPPLRGRIKWGVNRSFSPPPLPSPINGEGNNYYTMRDWKRLHFYLLTILFMFYPFSVYSQPQPIIEVGKFSAEKFESGVPANWKPLTFKKIERHTIYSLEKEDGTVVVKAVAEASASGLK